MKTATFILAATLLSLVVGACGEGEAPPGMPDEAPYEDRGAVSPDDDDMPENETIDRY